MNESKMDNKIEFDGRFVPPVAMEEIRVRAVAAVQRGYSPELVIDIMGISRSSMYEWLGRYEHGGYDALVDLPRSTGRPRHDNAEIQAKLKETVLNSTPLAHGYETALWNRAILAELVHRWYGVQVTEPTMGNWLRDLDLSPQVPLWRAQEQDPEAVRCFKEEKFPAIVQLAEKLGADLYFIDEFGYQSQEHAGHTWGLTGETPILHTSGKNFRWNVISAVGLKGQLRFKVIDGTVDGAMFNDFVRTLVQGSERPVIAIVDRHRIHTTACLRQERKTWRHPFKLFRFPAYSPELNPVEEVPNEVKNHAVGKQPYQHKADLKEKLNRALHSLQKKTQRIFSFFQTPDTEYISGYV
jgi:transposase